MKRTRSKKSHDTVPSIFVFVSRSLADFPVIKSMNTCLSTDCIRTLLFADCRKPYSMSRPLPPRCVDRFRISLFPCYIHPLPYHIPHGGCQRKGGGGGGSHVLIPSRIPTVNRTQPFYQSGIQKHFRIGCSE
jgi:hypothetical protein